MNIKLLKYEIRDVIGNIFTIFFGLIFPLVMSLLIPTVNFTRLSNTVRTAATTSVFLTMSMMIPLEIMIVAYGSNYALEREKEISIRMNLFGFNKKQLFISKFIAHLIFTIFSMLIYVSVDVSILNLQRPNINMLLIYIITMSIMSLLFFIIAHGIAEFCSKYSSAFATCMFVYFGLMILCGMMGVSVEQFPSSMKKISYLFPMSYLSSNDFVNSWSKGGYNCKNLILSLLFFTIIACVILLAGIYKERRRNK